MVDYATDPVTVARFVTGDGITVDAVAPAGMLIGTQVAGGSSMALSPRPVALSVAAPVCDFVRAEVISLGEEGPYRLTVFHARGRIVEYFSDTAAALRRQGELEDLLDAARGAGPDPGKHAV